MLSLVALALLLAPIIYVVSDVSSWSQLFFFATLTGVVSCIPLLFIGLNQSERRRFVLDPARDLGRRMDWTNRSQETRCDDSPVEKMPKSSDSIES